MVYVIEVHMVGGSGHEHIAEVKWHDPADGQTEKSSREQMVTWINNGGDARVKDGRGEAHVGVWDASPPYLRTYADERWTDNLLALPRY